jgi:hypothetical protein
MLPSTVIVGAIEYNVTEHEGLVVFRETHGLALGAFSSRYSFRQDREGAWTVAVDHNGHLGRVSTIMGLYRVVEAEYGAQAGGTLDENGRMQGPYRPELMPMNRKPSNA